MLIVDGNSIAWRAFYSGAKYLENAMAYTFLRMLRSSLDIIKPNQCRVVWDLGRCEWRREVYAGYKDRPAMESKRIEEFREQQEWLNRFLSVSGVAWVQHRGWEADDLIAAHVHSRGKSRYGKSHSKVPITIYSGDRDMWQLIEKTGELDVRVLNPDGGLLTSDNFEVNSGTGLAEPYDYFLLRVLVGDPSDKIPGIPGIGKAKATALLNAGWPSRPEAWESKPKEFWDTAAPIIERNKALMDLKLAGRKYSYEIGQLKWVQPGKKEQTAKQMVEEKGMWSIYDSWNVWWKIFKGLRTVPR